MSKCLMILAALLMLAGGCAQTRTYEVNVHNDTPGPLTVWLTKDGPPVEEGWKSPERLAIEAPGREERIGGVVVPAGKTASTGSVQGKFNASSSAILRIYGGQLGLADMLATDRDSSRRVDIRLHPGPNRIRVIEQEGRLTAVKPAQ